MPAPAAAMKGQIGQCSTLVISKLPGAMHLRKQHPGHRPEEQGAEKRCDKVQQPPAVSSQILPQDIHRDVPSGIGRATYTPENGDRLGIARQGVGMGIWIANT